MISAKNAPLGAAAQDLSLGDLLVQQTQDQVEARKKKLAGLEYQAMRGLSDNMMSASASDLLNSQRMI